MIAPERRRLLLAFLLASAAAAMAAPAAPGADESPIGSEEVEARKRLLEKAGQAVPGDSALAEVLRSERKFRKLSVSFPQEKEVQARYQDFLDGLPPGAWVSLEEARPILEMDLLLGRRENQERARRVQQEAARKRPEPVTGMEAQRLANFQPSELQLDLPPDRCLAFQAESRECILSVADFNRSALAFDAPRAQGLDSARRKLLDKSLNVLFYAREARRAGADNDPEMRRRLAQRMRAMASQGGRPPDIDSADLLRLYRKFHDSLFAEREEVELEILGGTDSAEVDSLYRIALAQTARKPRLKPTGKDSLPGLPWRRFRADSLPRALVAATDTLPLGGISPMVGQPYGAFVLRVASLRTVPEIPFEEARSRLFDMASQGALPEGVADLEARARAFHRARPRLFLSPDTVWIKLKLSSLRPKGAPRILRSTDLPPILLGPLKSAWAPRGPKSRPGQEDTVKTPFGPALVEVVRQRAGGRPLPFESVRPAVLAVVKGMPRALSDLPGAERERLASDEGLAQAFWTKAVQATPRPGDMEVAASLSAGAVPAAVLRTSATHADSLESARRWLFDQRWRKPQTDWKASLRFDWQALD